MPLKDHILKDGDIIWVPKIPCPDCELHREHGKRRRTPYDYRMGFGKKILTKPPRYRCTTCFGSGTLPNPNPEQTYHLVDTQDELEKKK